MGPECTPDGTGQLVGAVFTRMASMEPEFALRMEQPLPPQVADTPELQWSRSLHSGWNRGRRINYTNDHCFNGAGVCTPDGTAVYPRAGACVGPSMEPEFALRMERRHEKLYKLKEHLQWSRSLHSGWNCSLKVAKENKPCKRLFRAPERRGRIFLSIQHGGRKNSFILADCHCENPPL